MKDKTFIYGLKDPRNNQIRYIGKSDCPEQRLNNHISKSKTSKIPNKKNCWIKSLLNKNIFPLLEIIDEVSCGEWKFWEKHYIRLFKSFGAKLTNGTIGGDGQNIWTDESRKRLSKSIEKLWQDNNYRTNQINKHTGRKQSDEEIENRMKILLPILQSQEYKDTMSKAKKGHPSSEETNRKISVALTGIKREPCSQEKKEYLSNLFKNREFSEEWRHNLSESTLNRSKEPYTGKNNGMFGKHHNEESIKKQIITKFGDTKENRIKKTIEIGKICKNNKEFNEKTKKIPLKNVDKNTIWKIERDIRKLNIKTGEIND